MIDKGYLIFPIFLSLHFGHRRWGFVCSYICSSTLHKVPT